MATQTNQKVKQESKLFEGIYIEQMPILVSQGFSPATVADIMQLRLEGRASFDTYYDTSTAIYSGNNQDKFKIIPYSQDLEKINPQTELYNGGIRKTQEEYEALKGKDATEFSREEIITGRNLTEAEALEHKVWLALVNNNQELLKKYIQSVFKQVKDKYQEDKAMALYLTVPQEIPSIRPVYLIWLFSRSDVLGWNRLDYYARLAGVRDEKKCRRHSR